MTHVTNKRAQYHDTRESPLLLLQGDGDLTDSSGNGHTLTVNTGTENYCYLLPGLRGFGFDGSTILRFAAGASDTALQLTGAMTMAMIVLPSRKPSGENNLVSMGGATDTQADNALYILRAGGGGSDRQFQYSFEAGAAGDNFDFFANVPSYGRPFHWTLIRESDGDVTFVMDGRVVAQSSGLGAPDGGGSGTFKLGSNVNSGAGGLMQGALASFQVCTSAWTVAQAREAYNYTLGPVFGPVT